MLLDRIAVYNEADAVGGEQNVLAQSVQTSAKAKRAKFAPSKQQSNEQRQQATAADEQREKQQEAKQPALLSPVPTKPAAAASLDGLKARLAVKIQAMREQRKADEKAGKKRPRGSAAAREPAAKKRKGGEKKPKQAEASEEPVAKGGAPKAEAEEPMGSAISYGSLLLNGEGDKKAAEKKTRNGQGVRGIKNLLKKAERNQARLQELKQTAEGKALVEKKGWEKALKQAAGDKVMDDPKLLRNKLKKKEKQKAKSTKEWCVWSFGGGLGDASSRGELMAGVFGLGENAGSSAIRSWRCPRRKSRRSGWPAPCAARTRTRPARLRYVFGEPLSIWWDWSDG